MHFGSPYLPSSSSSLIRKYDVFISFSHEDTLSFFGCLSDALMKNDFDIVPCWGTQHLQTQLEECKIYIIAFSERYIDGVLTHRLDELLTMAGCMDTPGHIILPIFFYIDPSDHVRNSYLFKSEKFQHQNSDKVAMVLTFLDSILLTQRQDFVIRQEMDKRQVILDVVLEALKILGPFRIKKSCGFCYPSKFQRGIRLWPSLLWPSPRLPTWKRSLDVFLSFSTKDTSSFIQCLSNALEKYDLRINTSLDTKKDQIYMRIQDYKIYIVVFSKNYAPSKSSLKELANIAERMNFPGENFLPLFHEIDPLQVQNSYFLKHTQDLELDIGSIVKVHRWLATVQHQDFIVRDEIDQPHVIGDVVLEALNIMSRLSTMHDFQHRMSTFNYVSTVKRRPSSLKMWIERSDVFASFRSDEKTSSFVQYLSRALFRNDLKIDTSLNSTRRREPMEKYKICLVIFTNDYATSQHHFEELAMIAECMNSPGHHFLPIFFEVDPSQVLNTYIHERKRHFEPELGQVVKVQRWLAMIQRHDLIVRNEKDWRRVIGEVVLETLDIFHPITIGTTNISSSSSSKKSWRSDVFVSFRSEETSSSFVQYLLDALQINDLKIATSLDSTHQGPMEEYKIYMVVFSKSYAPSKPYLEELATIADCMNSSGHCFLSIFLEDDPPEVLNSYILKHIQDGELDLGTVVKVQRWLAMTQRQDFTVRHEIDQQRVIDEIVPETMKILGHKAFRLGNRIMIKVIDQTFEEMDMSGRIAPIRIQSHRVQKLVDLLDLGSTDVRLVGVCGMGGIGKTALTREVFNKISHRFDSTCFLINVSEYDFLLEEALLRATLQQDYVHHMDNIRGSLRLHRVLIVLDDVYNLGSLKDLVGNRHWFKEGSRIIIITRDEHILKMLGVDEILKVQLLNRNEARQLLCKTASIRNSQMRDYEKVITDALEYANGLPLAIESLGSSLQDKSVLEWQNVLAKLKIIPDPSIFMILKKSFDGLSKLQKEIFLDIACGFTGERINFVKEILNNYYGLLCVEETIGVLTDRSLVTILAERIQMHYMLQQMGKEIVRQESTAPEMRSRLWHYDDFRQVMEKNTETKVVKIIVLLKQEDSPEIPLSIEGLSKMSNLRILMFRNMNFVGKLNGLSNRLQYLSWHKYPFTCLPSNFWPHQLVELILPDSCITQLWGARKVCLPMLRNFNLRGSKYLLKLPSFVYLPNLERLDLEESTSLLRLDPSIGLLQRIKFLNLKNCRNLVSIPNELFGRNSLGFLNLAGCLKFGECLSFNRRMNKLPPILVKFE